MSCVGGQACIATGDAYPGAGTIDQALVESMPITRPGYRLAAGDGGVFALGGTSFYGSAATHQLTKPIVGMAADPSGLGYWLVTGDGASSPTGTPSSTARPVGSR